MNERAPRARDALARGMAATALEDGATITGVRSTPEAAGTSEAPRHRRESFPHESWDVDDSLETVAPVVAGELLGGKYIVEGQFAEGGMGIVCLGRHLQLDQPVAIKFLRRALSGKDAVIERFLNEARALASLRSEHVVRVMDVGQLDSGRPYLVMEHLEGISLHALIQRDGPLGVDTAIGYVLQVCEALGEAHALGIVHRDIKPENLFLWSGGPGQDIVKVLDFGLAKQLDSARSLGTTGPQDSIGSPFYMSPEQIMTPQLVDSRTDIWSLGAVLYELLTGAAPFEGAGVTQVFAQILTATPRSILQAVPSAGAELDDILARCLRRTPAERYPTMASLAEALSSYIAHRRASLEPNVLLGASRMSSVPIPLSMMEKDDASIRIPGVHKRWPAALAVLILLAGAGIYEANRTGHMRVRNLTDGWLTPARLGIEAPPPIRSTSYATPLNVVPRPSVVAPVINAPAVKANRKASIGAGREPARSPEKTTFPPAAELDPMSDAERAEQQANPEGQGLTPPGDVVAQPPDADPREEAVDPTKPDPLPTVPTER
ncbi:MAG TPA: protein kinase [Polyangiaceae bacterium]|nr:protein kinase [Polyangiaceae bacterium]